MPKNTQYADFGAKLIRIAFIEIDGVRYVNSAYGFPASAPITLATFADGTTKYEGLEVTA